MMNLGSDLFLGGSKHLKEESIDYFVIYMLLNNINIDIGN